MSAMKKKPFTEILYLKGDRLCLRALTPDDAPALKELTENPRVYRWLPTFLFEKKYPDPHGQMDPIKEMSAV